jgi:flavin-binding protein dodecin
MATRRTTSAASRAKPKPKAPKRYTGTSRVGIEEAVDSAVHKGGRAFKSGDRVRVVEIKATLRHSSPWHITGYSVTIEKIGGGG